MPAPRPPFISITLLSALSLAYEILLMRLFSIIQWHHFAYMIISLALLGYGFSGIVLALLQTALRPRFNQSYPLAMLLFSLSALGCFLLAQQLPFNAEELLWDRNQLVYLLTLFVLLALPFFFAASAICLALMHYPHAVARIYAVDLLGAGLGSMGIVVLLFALRPLTALTALVLLGLLTVGIAVWELQLPARYRYSVFMLLLAIPLGFAAPSLSLQLSPYKGLSQLLRISGTRIIHEVSSPLGLIDVVQSTAIPLRHAPGLSLTATTEPLPQLGVFTDGDNMTVITRQATQPEQLAYLDQQTSALPYHLQPHPHVLILGAGTGTDILQAGYHHPARIDAVEINPQLIALVRHTYADFSGQLYATPQTNLHLHLDEARDFLVRQPTRYDLIQLALLDAFNASSSGLYALNESYLYTTQALQLYLSRLNDNGYVAITRWITLPPRDTPKLFATAVAVLKAQQLPDIEQRLVLIRSWQTSTLLIKNGRFSQAELDALVAFCRARAFDIAYMPGITAAQANRYNILREPDFYLAAQALLGAQADTFIARYKFNIAPASDDRPFFHQFFKWSSLPEILALRHQGGMPLLEWGYLVLVFTLGIALGVGVVLMLAPLWLLARQHSNSTVGKPRLIGYFFTLGLAFLFIEIGFIQKFILFLAHPIYAVAIVLTAFLLCSGLGSRVASHLLARRQPKHIVITAVGGIAVLCGVYLIILPSLFAALAAAPILLKMLLSLLLIAPLAVCMGMPFPVALHSVAKHAASYVPWAWGINGFASVISAVLATLLAIHCGFSVVILLAVLLYLTSIVLFPAAQNSPG